MGSALKSAEQHGKLVLPPGAYLAGASAAWCVATYRNVSISHVNGAIDGDYLDACMKAHHAALAVDPDGYGIITLVEPGSVIPEASIRDRAAVMRRDTQDKSRAHSVVLGSDGFFASAMRGVITGIFALARSRVPLAMFGTDAEAVDFVVTRACAPSTKQAHVLELIQAMRGRSGAAA